MNKCRNIERNVSIIQKISMIKEIGLVSEQGNQEIDSLVYARSVSLANKISSGLKIL